MKAFSHVCIAMDKISRFLCVIMVSAIFAVAFVNTLCRYVFTINLLWAYDVCRILFVFFVFAATAVVYRMDEHIKFVFLETRYPPVIRRFMGIMFRIVGLCTFAVMAVYGFRLSYNSRTQIMPASGISASLFYLPLGLFAVFCIFFVIEFLLEEFTGYKREQILVVNVEEEDDDDE